MLDLPDHQAPRSALRRMLGASLGQGGRTPRCPETPRLDGRLAVVTGATGVIGGAIARELATTPGYELVLLARDEGRAKKAVDAIRSDSSNGDVRYVLADLSRRQSIQALADSWRGPLHVLVNDAGVAPRERETTPEGIELTFATNVLGYLWMTDAFAPHLERAAPAGVLRRNQQHRP